MKIKLDENLGLAAEEVFLAAGHDVLTVRGQGLGGKEDPVVIEVCRAEGRCLVTLDLDFSHILNYPPSRYPGIAVLRLPEPASLTGLLDAAMTLCHALETRNIHQKLWIVVRGKIREYGEES